MQLALEQLQQELKQVHARLGVPVQALRAPAALSGLPTGPAQWRASQKRLATGPMDG